MTVDDLILAAVEAALAAIDPVPDSIEVEPAGDPPGGRCLEIYDHGDEQLEREAMLTRWTKQLTISGFVDGEGPAAPVAERNALRAAVVRALMADDTLGGTVEEIEAGDCRRSTAVLASTRRLAFDQDFTIQFTTQRRDPALPA